MLEVLWKEETEGEKERKEGRKEREKRKEIGKGYLYVNLADIT